jgi:hypothetical protein
MATTTLAGRIEAWLTQWKATRVRFAGARSVLSYCKEPVLRLARILGEPWHLHASFN